MILYQGVEKQQGIEDWAGKTWPICLESPPQIAQMGIGVHGSQETERYRLPDLWCLHLYRYKASVQIDGQEFPIQPGFVSVIPADTPMSYRFHGRSPHLYAHFRAASKHSGTSETETIFIAAMQDFGDDFGRLYGQMEEVLHSEPRRAQARLWDILWQVAERGVPESLAGPPVHPAVGKAVREIERRLGEPLRAAALATEAGVSESYLARLFRASLGVSVVGYVRHRRLQRAVHLLRNSTLPIKTIAVLVGLPDLHHFNKTLHHGTGQSPRELRRTESCIEEPIVI